MPSVLKFAILSTRMNPWHWNGNPHLPQATWSNTMGVDEGFALCSRRSPLRGLPPEFQKDHHTNSPRHLLFLFKQIPEFADKESCRTIRKLACLNIVGLQYYQLQGILKDNFHGCHQMSKSLLATECGPIHCCVWRYKPFLSTSRGRRNSDKNSEMNSAKSKISWNCFNCDR